MSYTDNDTTTKPRIIAGAILGLIILVFLFYLFSDAGVSVSQAEYETLQDGMSYSQAVTIIGGEGSLVMDMSTMGMRVRSYEWHGPGGSIVLLNFEGDRLAGKMIA